MASRVNRLIFEALTRGRGPKSAGDPGDIRGVRGGKPAGKCYRLSFPRWLTEVDGG